MDSISTVILFLQHTMLDIMGKTMDKCHAGGAPHRRIWQYDGGLYGLVVQVWTYVDWLGCDSLAVTIMPPGGDPLPSAAHLDARWEANLTCWLDASYQEEFKVALRKWKDAYTPAGA